MKTTLITIAIGLSLLCTGCSIFPRLTTKPAVPAEAQAAIVKRSTKPIVVVSRLDEQVTVVTTEEEVESRTEYSKTPVKLTFAQRVGRWIAGIGTLAVVALIVGLVLCPATVIGFLVKTIKKWREAFIQTFKSIRDANGTKDPELKSALEANQSAKTKALVEEQKEKGL